MAPPSSPFPPLSPWAEGVPFPQRLGQGQALALLLDFPHPTLPETGGDAILNHCPAFAGSREDGSCQHEADLSSSGTSFWGPSAVGVLWLPGLLRPWEEEPTGRPGLETAAESPRAPAQPRTLPQPTKHQRLLHCPAGLGAPSRQHPRAAPGRGVAQPAGLPHAQRSKGPTQTTRWVVTPILARLALEPSGPQTPRGPSPGLACWSPVWGRADRKCPCEPRAGPCPLSRSSPGAEDRGQAAPLGPSSRCLLGIQASGGQLSSGSEDGYAGG